jgi:membrane-associated protein
MLAVNWLSPHDLIDTFGTIGLLLIVFVESGVIPAPLPGDSLLFLGGAFSATSADNPHMAGGLLVVVVGSFLAAVAGAEVGYWIGSRWGIRLFKPDARFFKTAYLERAHVFFEERGARAIVLARFIPFVRTIVPMLAGTSEMKHHKFFVANVLGAAVWACGITLLGYFIGNTIDIDKYIYPIVAAIIVLSLIPPFLEWRKSKKQPSHGVSRRQAEAEAAELRTIMGDD